MPREQLPPDPDAVEKWAKMPQNAPSPGALPPATGGTRWVWWAIGLLGTLVLLGVLVQLVSS
jgi:hypothetical protein